MSGLAQSLAVAESTLQAWAAAGCPVDQGRSAVVAWLRTRAAPAAPEDPLAARITAATDLAALAEVAREAAAAVASGALAPARASGVGKLLVEARRALQAQQAEPGAEEELLCTPAAANLARIYEGILSGHRRAALLEAARAAAAEDLVEFPDTLRTDPDALRAVLDAAGLDAWGDPWPASA